VVVGDFNVDGRADVAVVNGGGSNTVSVLLGNGDGSFQPAKSFAVGSGPRSMAVGDFNRDGRQDLVVVRFAESNQVSVLLGNGDGSFERPLAVQVLPDPVSVVVGDFNGDGVADLAVGSYAVFFSGVHVLSGKGDGSFELSETISFSGDYPSNLATAARDNGRMDLLVAGATGVSLLLANADGAFQSAENISTGSVSRPH
jgi:FG-GAP-like repeat/FG-GAP repeat